MKIIVIGASAGGLEALTKICSELPENFKGSVFIVWHIAEDSLGILPDIIKKKSKLPVSNAIDGEKIKEGHIYTAPPNKHLSIADGKMKVAYGPKENRFRPAIDPLFRSAAYYYGENVIGVILTGMLNDGSSGLWSVKDRGGITIVQDPYDALFPDMPYNALQNVKVDYKVTLEEIAPLLIKLLPKETKKTKKQIRKPDLMKLEVNMAMDKTLPEQEIKKLGEVTEFTCPECHGSLWKMKNGNILRFRCRTGHAYTALALLKDLSESVENQLWKTIRGLEENASLIRHISKHLKKDEKKTIDEYLNSAEQSERLSNTLRKILMEDMGSKTDANSEKNK